MRNDLSALAWRTGQYFEVNNYLEAAGIMCAMRAGVDPSTVRRPLSATIVEELPKISGEKFDKEVVTTLLGGT